MQCGGDEIRVECEDHSWSVMLGWEVCEEKGEVSKDIASTDVSITISVTHTSFRPSHNNGRSNGTRWSQWHSAPSRARHSEHPINDGPSIERNTIASLYTYTDKRISGNIMNGKQIVVVVVVVW